MNKQEKSAAKPTTKSQNAPMPVSKRFYSYVEERILEACCAVGADEAVFMAAMASIHGYILDSTVPAKETDTTVMLIFSLLRPEIDRAISRSSAARRRAAQRKARQETNESTIEKAREEVPEKSSNEAKDNTPIALREDVCKEIKREATKKNTKESHQAVNEAKETAKENLTAKSPALDRRDLLNRRLRHIRKKALGKL